MKGTSISQLYDEGVDQDKSCTTHVYSSVDVSGVSSPIFKTIFAETPSHTRTCLAGAGASAVFLGSSRSAGRNSS